MAVTLKYTDQTIKVHSIFILAKYRLHIYNLCSIPIALLQLHMLAAYDYKQEKDERTLLKDGANATKKKVQ